MNSALPPSAALSYDFILLILFFRLTTKETKPSSGSVIQHFVSFVAKPTVLVSDCACHLFEVNKISSATLIYLILLVPSVASAHAYLVKSVPAGRATLFSSPAKIQLWFNERLEPRYSSISVLDQEGTRVDLDNAQVAPDDPKMLLVGVKQLHGGRYLVKFRVLSVDGHIVEQSFPFTLREAK